jgi:DNA-binding response OmpR family regulator
MKARGAAYGDEDLDRKTKNEPAVDGVVKSQILVIDDDAAIRSTIEAVLTGAGYDVTCAADGEEGVRLFRALRSALVITDVVMPIKEGIETILALRERQPQVRIIAMSGGGRFAPGGGRSVSTDLLGMARAFGADHLLLKPFDADQLIAVVEVALRGDLQA